MSNRLVMVVLLLWPAWAGHLMVGGSLLLAEEQGHQAPAHAGDSTTAAPVIMKEPPIEIAEGANKCEIVSCGMGLKDTCEITCPSDKTPKCSCDCIRNIGPLCMEYKAICKCD